jgi:hypothetical protein
MAEQVSVQQVTNQSRHLNASDLLIPLRKKANQLKTTFSSIRQYSKLLFALIPIFVITIGIVIATSLAQKNQDIRSEAAGNVPDPTSIPDSNYYLGTFYMPKGKFFNNGSSFYRLKTFNRLQEKPIDGMVYTKPMLGYYAANDVQTMDWQLKWMLEAGIKFVVFDEFWTNSQSTPVYYDSMKSFMASSFFSQLDFAAMIVDFTIPEGNLDQTKTKFTTDVAEYYAREYFTKPNYLRINGKPVVYIFNTQQFDTSKNPAYIKSLLTGFEQTVGEKVYWVSIFPGIDNPALAKQMGFDAVTDYRITPGLRGTSINPEYVENGIDYEQYVESAYQKNLEMIQQAKSLGIDYIPNGVANFNDYYKYAIHPCQKCRGYIKNPNLFLYQQYLNDLSSLINQNTNSLPLINGKPLVSVGPYNEWLEGNFIEPGKGDMTQGRNPFAILRVIKRIFTNDKTLLVGDSIDDRTPVVPEKHQWSFSDATDRQFWQPTVTSTDFIPLEKTRAAYSIADDSIFKIHGAVNVDLEEFSGFFIKHKVECDQPQCLDKVKVVWYWTECTGDTPESCPDGTEPTHVAHQTITVENGSEKKWSVINFPELGENITQGKLELVEIDYFLKEVPSMIKIPTRLYSFFTC